MLIFLHKILHIKTKTVFSSLLKPHTIQKISNFSFQIDDIKKRLNIRYEDQTSVFLNVKLSNLRFYKERETLKHHLRMRKKNRWKNSKNVTIYLLQQATNKQNQFERNK